MVESRSAGDRAFRAINYTILTLILLVTLYPCWYVVVASFSDPVQLYGGSKILLWPRGFSLAAYEIIMEHTMLWKSYANTLLYVTLSTVVGLALTILGSYVLSRRALPGQRVMLTLIMITMFFGGGLIPTYLIVVELGLIDSIWSMVLPSAISTYNLIMMLTYFRTMPLSLEESARIDGANNNDFNAHPCTAGQAGDRGDRAVYHCGKLEQLHPRDHLSARPQQIPFAGDFARNFDFRHVQPRFAHLRLR